MLSVKAQELIKEAKERQLNVNPQVTHEPQEDDFKRGQRASMAGIKRAPKFDRAFMRTLGKDPAINIGRLKKWFEGFDNAQANAQETVQEAAEIYRKKIKEKYGIDVDKMKDKLSGGKGQVKNLSQYDLGQLTKGIDTELEHTKNKSTALEIATDHLEEDPRYYDKLAKVEKK